MIVKIDNIGCVFPRVIWFCYELSSIEKLALSRTAGEFTEQGHEVKEARWTPERILGRMLHHCHKTGGFTFVRSDRPVWVIVYVLNKHLTHLTCLNVKQKKNALYKLQCIF